jgi:hypothetical protein
VQDPQGSNTHLHTPQIAGQPLFLSSQLPEDLRRPVNYSERTETVISFDLFNYRKSEAPQLAQHNGVRISIGTSTSTSNASDNTAPAKAQQIDPCRKPCLAFPPASAARPKQVDECGD